jgi:TPR repeat protein
MKNMVPARYFVWLLAWLLALPVSAETDSERAERLFKEGYVHYQQHYTPLALPKLKEAASLGHAEAAYFAGEIIRQRSVMNDRAIAYYRQAAKGGEVYAMLRLTQTDSFCGIVRDCDPDEQKRWLEKAEEVALARAKAGDTEAMMELFSVYWSDDNSEAFDWTKKAAENGNAFAQYWLAVGLLDEREMGFYWTDSGRREDVIKWLRASAENGFPKAMEKLAIMLKDQGDFEEAQYWVRKMATTDYYHAVLNAGALIMMGPDIAEVLMPSLSYEFEKPRPVEGAALLMALHRQTGKEMALGFIDDYRDYMTPEMLEAAKERSKELLVDTPILYYEPKFGL